MAVEIRPEPYGSAVARPLTDALAAELRGRYDGFDGAGGEPDPSVFGPPDGHFVVAWEDGAPLGCGGVARSEEGEDEGEIRRMYVVPAARGRGISKAVLVALEHAARASGYASLRLETGDAQPEACALYAGAGYERIPPYGPYAEDPRSVCFAKRL